MAIVTTAEVKTFLQISGSAQDDLIGSMIPEAQSLFQIVRGIPFFEIEADITSADATITEISDADLAKAEVGAYLEATGIPVSATQIDEVNSALDGRANHTSNNIEMSAVATASTEDLLITIYPPGSKYTASKIVEFLMNKESNTGKKSESIGSYQYTKFDSKTGLPSDITGTIQKFQHVYT